MNVELCWTIIIINDYIKYFLLIFCQTPKLSNSKNSPDFYSHSNTNEYRNVEALLLQLVNSFHFHFTMSIRGDIQMLRFFKIKLRSHEQSLCATFRKPCSLCWQISVGL